MCSSKYGEDIGDIVVRGMPRMCPVPAGKLWTFPEFYIINDNYDNNKSTVKWDNMDSGHGSCIRF